MRFIKFIKFINLINLINLLNSPGNCHSLHHRSRNVNFFRLKRQRMVTCIGLVLEEDVFRFEARAGGELLEELVAEVEFPLGEIGGKGAIMDRAVVGSVEGQFAEHFEEVGRYFRGVQAEMIEAFFRPMDFEK